LQLMKVKPQFRGSIILLHDGGGDRSATVAALPVLIDALRAHGYPLHTILACGGGTKNDVFLREHADATGCRVVLPAEPEAVLLGAAILGAVASADRASILEAMSSMTHAGRTIEPTRGAVADYHDAKHAVFLRMHDDQLAYREIMNG